MGMIRQVRTCTQRDRGYWIEIIDVPQRYVILEWVWNKLCILTWGWAGGHGMPHLLWYLPVGWPKWDRSDPDDHYLVNSLPVVLMELENRILFLRDRRNKEKLVADIDVTVETVVKIQPDFQIFLEQDRERMERS